MLSQLTFFSQGLLGCRGQRSEREATGEGGERRGEHQISSSRTGCDHINYRSWEGALTFVWCIFRIRGADLFFLMKVTGVSSFQEKKKKKKSRDLKSCCELSHGDIFRRLRCETSICEFLPRGEEAGEDPTYRTPANVLNRLQRVNLRLQILNISDRGLKTCLHKIHSNDDGEGTVFCHSVRCHHILYLNSNPLASLKTAHS